MKKNYLSIHNILHLRQLRQVTCTAILFVMAILLPGKLFAQAPAISYSTPHTYVVDTAIPSLSPVNTGGVVPSFGYNTPTVVNTGVSDPVCMVEDNLGNMYIGESSGQISVVATGASAATVLATGFGPVNQIALDGSNNVYLADGTHIWKIPAGGGTPATLGSFTNPVSVAVGPDGNLYVGDKNYADGLYQVSPAGNVLGRIQTINSPGVGSPTNLLLDGSGNLVVADNFWSSLLAGQAVQGFTLGVYANGLSGISFLAIDPSGNIFLSDNNGIQRYTPGNRSLITITSVSADGLMVDANYNLFYADGHNIYKMSPNGYFCASLPTGLSVDPNSGIISGTPGGTSPAADYHITAFNVSGGSTATINITVNPALPSVSYNTPQSYQVGTAIGALSPSSSNVASWGYSGTPSAIGSGIIEPIDVAANAAGDVYVADVATNNIVKIPAGNGTPVVLAAFSNPFGLAVDATGNVYVAAVSADVIIEYPAGGGATNAIGSGFIAPSAVAVDRLGNVYVADAGHGALKEVPAGNGTPVTLQSGFANIQGVTVDGAGNIYVADGGVGTSGNGAVYKIPAGGGSMSAIGTGFSRPSGVVVDAGGNLYVSDVNKSVITVIEPDGTQFSIGSGFNQPNGIALDGSGNLYIADSSNGKVKEVKVTGGYFLSSFLPAGLTFDNNTGTISGTPESASPTANYTITGRNVTGSTTAAVSITVGAPVISYTSPVAYATGVAITPLTPSVAGGAVASLGFGTSVTVTTGLNDATCMAMDKSGNIYIGESSGKISKLATGSSTATVFATGFSTNNVLEGIAVDASGNVYFADGSSVWKIPAGGGTAIALGTFDSPLSVALDIAGNVYVCDDGSASHGVYKMAPDGTGKTRIDTNLPQPLGIAVDANGNVFVGDLSNQAVYKIPAGGTQTHLTDIVGLQAVTADAAGNVYLAGGSLLFFSPANGSGVVSIGSTGPYATGLMTDANFNLYYANGTISKISPTSGYFISPELPPGLTIDPNTGVISGTPSAAAPTANHTVKAFNTNASATATVNITIGPAPAISYSTPQTFTQGTAVTPLLPQSTGAAVAAPGFNTTTLTLSIGITDATCTAIDKNGNLYIGESSGKVSVLAPGSTTAAVFATGFNTNVSGGSIAVDASGNVYVADGLFLWKIPAGGGIAVKLGSFGNPSQVFIDASGSLYVRDITQGIYKMASDGSNKTKIFNGFTTIMAADQNGNVFFSSRGVGAGLYEVPAGGTSKVIIPSATFRAFATDPSGNVYMINSDASVGMVPAGGVAENRVEPAITGISSIMIGPDFNLYAVVSGRIIKAGLSGGYFISPQLPAGLTIDPATGAISGTPAAVSAATDYTVTAFSGSVSDTATVNVKVNPALSTDATLSNLTLNAGLLLTPSFSPGVTTYTRNMANRVHAVIVPHTNDPNATILINGTTSLASGAASNPLPLSVGTNTITVQVTAQDGVTTNTYTLILVRAGTKNDLLSSLRPSRGVLSPRFARTTTNYTASVAGGVTSMTVTPTAVDPNATIVVNGTDVVPSGAASDPITLLPGQNTITTTVTAPNDTATRTYTLTVTREISKNDLLSALKLSAGVKNPVFRTNVINYTANVRNSVSSISIIPTASDPSAILALDGERPIASGTKSDPIPLAVGPNTISVKVTAPDGVTNQTYTVIVTRAAAPGTVNVYQPVGVEKPTETPIFADDAVLVHQAISPNGDGINDFLQIDNIRRYPDNKLSIMNRNGQLIYEAKGYDNSLKVFDGHSNQNGQMQLAGTYFYQLDYTVNGIIKHKTGFMVLKY